MGYPTISADRIRLLRKALGQFDRVPYVKSQPAGGGPPSFSAMPPEASRLFLREPGVSGAFFSQDDGLERPVAGAGRAFAVYPKGDRAVRRHELFHGVQKAARLDPELGPLVPWWARGAPNLSFRDELAARLAARSVSDQVLNWDLGHYSRLPGMQEKWMYYAAMPAQVAARAAREMPLGTALSAAAAGTALGVGSKIASDMLYGEPRADGAPAEMSLRYDPIRGREILERLAAGGYR